MKKPAILKNYIRFTILIVLIFLANDLNAQKKISLDVNVGVLHSIGKNIVNTYNSNINPLHIQYYSREKFKQPYFNILLSLNYALNRNFFLGLQTGIYTHFSEQYEGVSKPIIVSVPLMVTFRMKVTHIKANDLGINLAVGRTYFDIDANNINEKNGAILNASFFCHINKRSIIKFGIEKEIDNASLYFSAPNPLYKDETITYHINRLSVLLSYGFILKK
jgi:hypothetical protein